MRSKTKKSLTIRSEIFLLSFLFISLVSLIFAGIFLKFIYDCNVNSARNSLRQCSNQVVTYTEGMFHENASIVKILAKDPTIIYGENGPSEALSIYDYICENNTNITYIYSGYVDKRMYIGEEYNLYDGYDPTIRPWYQAAMNTDGVARLVYIDAVTNEWLFSQCMKLVDSSGNIVGVVSIDCSNESISRQLSTKYQYDSQRSYIVDPQGTVLIHPEEKHVNDSILNYMDKNVWEDVINGTSNYGEYKKDGINALVHFEWIPETKFIVATAIDDSEVTMPIIRNMWEILAIVVCISIGLGFILSRVLIYRFARPIIALENRIRKVAIGCTNNDQDFAFSNVEINDIANSIEVIVKDIAKKEEERKTAEYLSFHDSMTGVYNRRFFTEELQRLDNKHNYPLCIIGCDINALKLVNDVFGHDAGDSLIHKVTRCLEKSCRHSDIIARIGGDEFSIIMPNTSVDDVHEIIRSIKFGFSKENVCKVAVTASLGYAVKENNEEAMDEIIQRADEMMYTEKMMESAHIRRNMVNSIIATAQEEKFIKSLTQEEDRVLEELADVLCPESKELLKQSYQFRNIGLCTIFLNNISIDEADRRHTEIGYRVLGVFDEYRNIAGCVLHYTEHMDGSGWPAGLSGSDIPLVSRIIKVADTYFTSGGSIETFKLHHTWYDPKIIEVLEDIVMKV